MPVKVLLKGGPGSGHHGHVGRPGQRGGSAAGTGGGMVGGSFPSGPDETTDDIEGWFSGTTEEIEERVAPDTVNKGNWGYAARATRSALKDDIAHEIARTSDAAYDEASTTMESWAHSSNDHDMRSLSVQQAAAKEFGVPVSDFVKERVAEVSAQKVHEVAAMGKPLMAEDRQRIVLRAMYENTQKQLRTTYGPDDTIRLRRGIILGSEVDRPDWVQGGKGSVVGNPLESWSFSAPDARGFAEIYDDESGNTGYVLEMDVPIKNIFSTALTGSGCLTEGEFIVIGSMPGQALVEVIG